MTQEKLKSIALSELNGVGDASLGEWHEWTGKAYHIRRRMTPAEQETIGPAIDVRGTSEGYGRARAITIARPAMAQYATEEVTLK